VIPPEPVKIPENYHLTDTRMQSLKPNTDKFKGIRPGSQTCKKIDKQDMARFTSKNAA